MLHRACWIGLNVFQDDFIDADAFTCQ